ncbi:MAG: adenylyltransferase/cytidyltransferase family protein [Candidatus Micrarchaeia archaeon]
MAWQWYLLDSGTSSIKLSFSFVLKRKRNLGKKKKNGMLFFSAQKKKKPWKEKEKRMVFFSAQKKKKPWKEKETCHFNLLIKYLHICYFMKAARKLHAIFIGRFQPPHLGHEKAISYLLKKYEKITIAIGSSNKKRDSTNPFCARERLYLLRKIIHSHAGWKNKISLCLLKDNPSDKQWALSFRKRFSPNKYAIFSANSLVRNLLKKEGYALDGSPLFNRIEWEGTKIREKMRKNIPCSLRLPVSIRQYMKSKGEKIICACKQDAI